MMSSSGARLYAFFEFSKTLFNSPDQQTTGCLTYSTLFERFFKNYFPSTREPIPCGSIRFQRVGDFSASERCAPSATTINHPAVAGARRPTIIPFRCRTIIARAMNQPRSPSPPSPRGTTSAVLACDDDGRTDGRTRTRPRSNGNGARRPRARLLSSGGHVCTVHVLFTRGREDYGRPGGLARIRRHTIRRSPCQQNRSHRDANTATSALRSGDPSAPPAVHLSETSPDKISAEHAINPLFFPSYFSLAPYRPTFAFPNVTI